MPGVISFAQSLISTYDAWFGPVFTTINVGRSVLDIWSQGGSFADGIVSGFLTFLGENYSPLETGDQLTDMIWNAESSFVVNLFTGLGNELVERNIEPQYSEPHLDIIIYPYSRGDGAL